MQIVIDIPDELKKALDNNEEYRLYTESVGHIMLTAIKNGTPLPKYHGDLKDVNKIKKEAIDMSQWGSDTAYGVWVEDIDSVPTIIPATEEEVDECI